MRRARRAHAVLLLAAACCVAGCRGIEGPLERRDASGWPGAPPVEAPATGRYVVEAAVVPGAASAGAGASRGGLRAGVVASSDVPGSAEAHGVVEGVAAPIPVGEAVWPADAPASRATADPAWRGARVAVEWLVTVRARGSCAVEVEVTPRLLGACGAAVLVDWTSRAVLAEGEALEVSSDGRVAAARALLGPRGAAGPARWLLRVRGAP